MEKPALYIVPTPIGNLDDITLRALKILEGSDIILCEDTRRSGKLIKKLDIMKKTFISYHEHNEKVTSKSLIENIINNKLAASLISDAGTPGISDPGFRLVKEAIDKGLKIVPLPGPTAFIPALVASGLPLHNFLFLGFPPHKKGRTAFIRKASESEFTIVLYESTHRIKKLTAEIKETFGPERKVCIAREISKIYEEYLRGTAGEIASGFEKIKSPKGEFVVIIEGKS